LEISLSADRSGVEKPTKRRGRQSRLLRNQDHRNETRPAPPRCRKKANSLTAYRRRARVAHYRDRGRLTCAAGFRASCRPSVFPPGRGGRRLSAREAPKPFPRLLSAQPQRTRVLPAVAEAATRGLDDPRVAARPRPDARAPDVVDTALWTLSGRRPTCHSTSPARPCGQTSWPGVIKILHETAEALSPFRPS